MSKLNDPTRVVIQTHDGNGTYNDISAMNPLPGTGTGGSGGSGSTVTAYGDPESFGLITVTTVAATLVSRDLQRTRLEIWNLSAWLQWSGSAWVYSPNSGTVVTIAPVRQGTGDTVTFGAGIMLPPVPTTGFWNATPQYSEYTTSAYLAIHNATGNVPLLVTAWSS